MALRCGILRSGTTLELCTRSWGNQLEWDDKGTRKAQGVQRPENAGRCPVGEPAQVGGSARRVEGNATTRVVAVGGGPTWTGGSGGIRHQEWRRLLESPGLDAGAEVVQHLLALPPAGFHHRQDPLHEAAALRTVRAATGLPPQHPMPFGTLRLVVGRFHPYGIHERPQPLFVLLQFLAGPCRLAAAAPLSSLQRAPYRFTDWLHALLEWLP